MTLYIAVIGTSDQSCWLAEACKIPSLELLEGVWIYGVTVHQRRSYDHQAYESVCMRRPPRPTLTWTLGRRRGPPFQSLWNGLATPQKYLLQVCADTRKTQSVAVAIAGWSGCS